MIALVALGVTFLEQAEARPQQSRIGRENARRAENAAPISLQLFPREGLGQPQQNTQPYQFNYYPQQQADKGAESFLSIGADLWVAIFTAALVLATCVQAYLIIRAEKLTWQALRVSQRQAVRAKIDSARHAQETKGALDVAERSAKAAEDAAKATAAANKLNADLFRAEHRPIISVVLGAYQDLVWENGELKTTVRVELTNHGQSPATIFHVPIKIAPNIGRPPFQNINAILDDLAGKDAITVVEKNSAVTVIQNGKTWSHLQEIKVTPAAIGDAQKVVVNILGCVRYGSFSEDVYVAGFAWQLGWAGPDKRIKNWFDVGKDRGKGEIALFALYSGNFDRRIPEEDLYRQ